MKVYAHSIDGVINSLYLNKEAAQKCVDNLNNVFDARRRRNGMDFDLRVAVLEELDTEIKAEPLSTEVQWRVTGTCDLSGPFDYYCETRKLAREYQALIKEQPHRHNVRVIRRVIHTVEEKVV